MHLFTLTRNPQALAFHVGVVSSKFYSKIVHERIARFPEGDPSTSGHVKGSQSSCRTACDTPFLLISHLTFGSQIRKGMMMRACSHNSRECCWMSHPLLVPLISRLRRWLHLWITVWWNSILFSGVFFHVAGTNHFASEKVHQLNANAQFFKYSCVFFTKFGFEVHWILG